MSSYLEYMFGPQPQPFFKADLLSLKTDEKTKKVNEKCLQFDILLCMKNAHSSREQ